MKLTKQLVVFDVADLETASTFWANILGGTVEAKDDWHTVKLDGDWHVAFQLAPNHVPPDWPDGGPSLQMHLDLWVDDLEAAHQEVISHGARLLKPADDPNAKTGFQVYTDPIGHPFCLCW